MNETRPSGGSRRTKRIWLVLALVMVGAAVVVGVLWFRPQPAPPQIVRTRFEGDYQFAGVTYGTRGVGPSLEAEIVSWLPSQLQILAKRRAGTRIPSSSGNFHFDTPQLCVWLKRWDTNSIPNWGISQIPATLADQAGVEGGLESQVALGPSMSWSLALFPVIPRRSPVLLFDLRLPDLALPAGSPSTDGVVTFKFPNPLYGHFPQWKPEPVPAVKKAGDLEVRLEKIMSAAQVVRMSVDTFYVEPKMEFRTARKGETSKFVFDVHASSTRGTNEEWLLQGACLSDATGNVLPAPFGGALPVSTDGRTFGLTPMPGLSEFRKILPGTLWPGEDAWKLKLEFKRQTGLSSAELVTFKRVPVPAIGTANTNHLVGSAGGVSLLLVELLRKPARTNSSNAFNPYDPPSETQVLVGLPEENKGVAVDFVKLRTNDGQDIQIQGNAWAAFSRTIYLAAIPTNATTVDITFSVQKMRSVEFLVKPPAR